MKGTAALAARLQTLIRENMTFDTLSAAGHEGKISEASWGAVVRVASEPISIQHGAYFSFRIPAEVAASTDPGHLDGYLRLTAYHLAADVDAYIRGEIRARSTASTTLDGVPAAIAAADAPADDFRAIVPILEADEDDPRLQLFHVLPSFDRDEEIIILAPGNIAFAGEIVRMEAYQANSKEVGMAVPPVWLRPSRRLGATSATPTMITATSPVWCRMA